MTVVAFGAGFVVGARAGRDRYEQLVELARRAGTGMETAPVRDRLEWYASRLEGYAKRNGDARTERPTASSG